MFIKIKLSVLLVLLSVVVYLPAQELSELLEPNLINHYQALYDQKGDLNQLRGTGFMPFQRLNRFYQDRVMADGSVHARNRLEVFKDIFEQQAYSRSGSSMANWQSAGPDKMDTYAGRVISHAFDPEDPDKLWVGSASGGLWLTEDRGENWRPMTDEIPSCGVGAVAVHPTNGDKIIIGTGEGFAPVGAVLKPGLGIFKSDDGGVTWQETNVTYSLAADVSFLDMVWHPTDHSIIWAAGSNGLWKSENGGDTWHIVLGDGTNHQNYIIDDIIIQHDDPEIMFIGRENVGIFKSTDGGETFVQITNGLPTTDLNFINISQCTSAPNVLYSSIIKRSDFSLRGVYKSVDGGESWVNLPSAPNAPCSPQIIGLCQGWYNNFVAVSPFNPDLVTFGGVTMWMSTDGGVSWVEKDRLICPTCGIPPPCTMWGDHHDFAFSPHDSLRMYTLSDGGISRSDDGGQCFTDKNHKLNSAQLVAAAISRKDPNVIIGGLFDHGLHAVDLSVGTDWFKWGWFDGADVEIHSNDPNTYYGTWIDGTYWKYKKGVNVWADPINVGINLSENTSQFWAPLAIHPTNGAVLLGSTQQQVYRSDNAGLSWTPVLQAVTVTDLRFSEADHNIAYAVAWNNSSWTFHRSEDQGRTWVQTLGAPGWRVTDLKTSASDPMTVFASRNSINSNTPHVYKSTDGGDTWISIQGNMPDIITNTIEVDHRDHDIIYCGTDLGVFLTRDGGLNWTPFNEGMPITYVYDLQYNPTDTSLVAATMGRGAWKTYLGESMSSTFDAEPAKINFDIYPNPAYHEVKIVFERIENDAIQLNILDALGQFREKIVIQENDVLFEEITYPIDRKKLNAGMYYVQLITDGKSYLRPLVIR